MVTALGIALMAGGALALLFAFDRGPVDDPTPHAATDREDS